MHQPIRLFFYRSREGIPNFGDELSQQVVEFVTSRPVKRTGRMTCDMTAIGSILDRYFRPQARLIPAIRKKLNRPILVWGSGLIKEKQYANHSFRLSAVRGKLTRNALGGDLNTKLGDPALFASAMMRGSKTRSGIGIVPHFTDKNHHMVNSIAKIPGVKIIDVERNGPEVCADIGECAVILSSSLHGLIVADSFKIPNYRLAFNERLVGGDFKFLDYASAINRKNIDAIGVSDPKKIKKLVSADYDDSHFSNIEHVCTELEIALKSHI